MTTPTRAEKCADLARAMGWTESSTRAIYPTASASIKLWICPQTGATKFDPPDPFTDAEVNRKLLEWLTGQLSPTGDESLMIHWFFLYLLTAVSDRANKGKNLKDYNFGQRVLTAATMLHLLAAPLETIAEAAWRAIQEKAKW